MCNFYMYYYAPAESFRDLGGCYFSGDAELFNTYPEEGGIPFPPNPQLEMHAHQNAVSFGKKFENLIERRKRPVEVYADRDGDGANSNNNNNNNNFYYQPLQKTNNRKKPGYYQYQVAQPQQDWRQQQQRYDDNNWDYNGGNGAPVTTAVPSTVAPTPCEREINSSFRCWIRFCFQPIVVSLIVGCLANF